MQKQIYYLGKISLIILCALLASAASQDLQNEFNQDEETNDGNKGFFPADFWTSREVKVSEAMFYTKYLSSISQIDEIGLKTHSQRHS